MIPSVKDDFWVKLVKNEIEHDFEFYALRLFIAENIEKYKEGAYSLDETINKIHQLCHKFPNTATTEIESIIKTNERDILRSIQEVSKMILSGKVLLVLGSDELLRQLPKGNWIGTTMSYFMTDKEGVFDDTRLFAHDFTNYVEEFEIISYTKDQTKEILEDRYDGGFSYLLMPYLTEIAHNYAMTAIENDDLFRTPILGFQGGGKFEDVSNGVKPFTYDGTTGIRYTDKGVVLHAKTYKKYFPSIEIVNIFEPDPESPVLVFEEGGFNVKYCMCNGEKVLLSKLMKEMDYGVKWPLVTNYGGARINSSIFYIDEEKEEVAFAAPIVAGREYRFAKQFDDYMLAFQRQLPDTTEENVVTSLNCLYNYFYCELEGKQLDVGGPMSYGEIAYRLVNQTLVYLKIDRVEGFDEVERPESIAEPIMKEQKKWSIGDVFRKILKV